MADYPTTPVKASIGDLGWMVGSWRGRRGEDPIEEHWSEPAGNGIMGMFRWLHDGQPRFYELLTFEEEEGEILLRIKHFNPGLKGWEEKEDSVTLVLVGLTGEEAWYWNRNPDKSTWIVYRRVDPDTLITFFERGGAEPHTPEQEFRYKRFALGGA